MTLKLFMREALESPPIQTLNSPGSTSHFLWAV